LVGHHLGKNLWGGPCVDHPGLIEQQPRVVPPGKDVGLGDTRELLRSNTALTLRLASRRSFARRGHQALVAEPPGDDAGVLY
jgi:hypothetical protein